MVDRLTEVAPMHTITASETVGAAYAVLPGDLLNIPMSVRVQYLDANQASGSGVWTFTAQLSYDEGVTWTTVATGAAITLTATVQDGEQTLNFSPSKVSSTGQTWVQVLCTLTGTPVTPTIAYRADLNAAMFG